MQEDEHQPPLPPPDFDPRTATPEELRRYGLPPRPSEAQPHLLRFWLRLFTPPLRFEYAEFVPEGREQRRAPPRLAGLFRPVSRWSDSANWSGAELVPHDGRQIVFVGARWRVPTPALPAHADQIKPPEADYRCSVWIGFDGARRYHFSSLPQIGTEQRLVVAAGGAQTIQCRGFFQWWDRARKHNHLEYLPHVAIKPGDEVAATLWALDATHVALLFIVFGAPTLIAIGVKQAPLLEVASGTSVRPTITGATAEWIVERPRDDSLALRPFPDYGRVTFADCVTGTARAPGPYDGEIVLQTPRLLRLFEVPPNAPVRTRIISRPEPITTTGELAVAYQA